jgi:hypothetical protein
MQIDPHRQPTSTHGGSGPNRLREIRKWGSNKNRIPRIENRTNERKRKWKLFGAFPLG